MKLTADQLDELSGSNPGEVFTVPWDVWARLPTASIDGAVALSVGLDPVFANVEWAMRTVERIEQMKEIGAMGDDENHPGLMAGRVLFSFVKRRIEAIENIQPLGNLEVIDHDGERRVNLAAFAEWALSRNWELPRKFPTHSAMMETREAHAEKWPWGGHETKLLRNLANAAEKFWKLYDPEDPTTAPTNEAVTKYLEGEGVARRTAETMATILRADGLRTGPRK